jgi:methylated-DNA-[protein]-cysteine S-methyltransferase
MSGDRARMVYGVWTTAWGPMGAVASARGLCRVVLPHYQADDLRALLAFEHPGSIEAADAFAELTELSRAYCNGRPADFVDIVCDLPSEKTFTGRVLRCCRRIPYGQTQSYSSLAAAAGKDGSARAVATVMGKNRLPLVIPCHRVIYANGGLGGFSAPGGVELKRRMLALETAL